MKLRAIIGVVTIAVIVVGLQAAWYTVEGLGTFGLVGGMYGPGIFLSSTAAMELALALLLLSCVAAVVAPPRDPRLPLFWSVVIVFATGALSFALVHPLLSPAILAKLHLESLAYWNPFWFRPLDACTWASGAAVHLIAAGVGIELLAATIRRRKVRRG